MLNHDMRTGRSPILSCLLTLLLLSGFGHALLAPVHAEGTFQVRSLKEIREHSVVIQRWDNSCAAASLATVLTYGFRDPVTEQYIARRMLQQTAADKVRARGGFSLLDMMLFVEQRGYQAGAYQHLSLDDLKLFHAPIVPISVHGYNHYVVVNAVTDDQVLLADPAFGNRTMSHRSFNRAWLDGIGFVIQSP